jgi:diguanylate cyclase (GGDEF)-like protein
MIADNPREVESFRSLLIGVKHNRFTVEREGRLPAALERLERGGIELILLDLAMPETRELEALLQVRDRWPEVPVVVLIGPTDEALGERAVAEGAQDYLIKGQTDSNLLGRVLGHAVERQRMQLALSGLTHDPLTCLFTCRALRMLGEQQLKVGGRRKRAASLLVADVDRLKKVNDEFGYREGNRVLTKTAALLRQSVRDSDIVARLGGDEFGVLLIDCPLDDALRTATRFQKQLQDYNAQRLLRSPLSISVGVASLDGSRRCSVGDLLARAMQAMLDHKESKRRPSPAGRSHLQSDSTAPAAASASSCSAAHSMPNGQRSCGTGTSARAPAPVSGSDSRIRASKGRT